MCDEDATDYGVDFDFAEDSDDDCDLFSAAKKGDVRKLMELLDSGAFDVNICGIVSFFWNANIEY
jgi:hypothetical protein